MTLYSKDKTINDQLNNPLFKDIKAAKLQKALQYFEDFAGPIEVFKGTGNKVYIKDNKGNQYEFTLCSYNYGDNYKTKELFSLEVKYKNLFYTYNYFDNLKLEKFGVYHYNGTVITKYHQNNSEFQRYTLEKGNEKYSLLTNYTYNLLHDLEMYCSIYEHEEGFTSFLEFCRQFNTIYKSHSIVEYSDSNTIARVELYLDKVKDFNLNITSSTEIVNLAFKDGKLTEDYKEIREITPAELSEKSKAAVHSVKSLIKH